MRNPLLLCFCLLSASLTLSSCKSNRTSQKWDLVWKENFNQKKTFDSKSWSKIPRGGSDWNNYMSDFDSCYAMRNGNLVLRGMVNYSVPNDTAPYITGGIYTKDKVSFTNGRLEIGAKLPDAQGAWPAIWLLPTDAPWPMGGEIDIMEHLNHDTIVYQTVHSYYTYKLGIKTPQTHATTPIVANEYNVYAVEMYPDSLSFYVNDKHTFTYPRIETDKEGQYPFDRSFYLLIDMQLGGSWVGKVDPKELPVEMEVDWVRFYQKRKNAPLK